MALQRFWSFTNPFCRSRHTRSVVTELEMALKLSASTLTTAEIVLRQLEAVLLEETTHEPAWRQKIYLEARIDNLLVEHRWAGELHRCFSSPGIFQRLPNPERIMEGIRQFRVSIDAVRQGYTGFDGNLPDFLQSQSNASPHYSRGLRPSPVVPRDTGLRVSENVHWIQKDFNDNSVAGQVRRGLLEGINGRCSSNHHNTVIQVTGRSGIGKTGGVNSLVEDQDHVLCSTFNSCGDSGGKHLIRISDAKNPVRSIIKNLAYIAELSGSREIALLIQMQETLLWAIHYFLCRFKDKHCAFFVEDSIEDHPDWYDIFTMLAKLSTCSYKSALVVIRQTKILKDDSGKPYGNVIHLRPAPQSLQNRSTFLKLAGHSEESVAEFHCELPLREVLDICEGLVIQVHTAARSVRNFCRCMGMSFDQALKSYIKRYTYVSEKVCMDELKPENRPYAVMLQISLETLETIALKRKERNWSRISTNFIALCVLQEEEKVSSSVLQRYLKLPYIQDANDFVSLLNQEQLGYKSEVEIDGRREFYLRLHHRDIECCQIEAKRSGIYETCLRRRAEIFPAKIQ